MTTKAEILEMSDEQLSKWLVVNCMGLHWEEQDHDPNGHMPLIVTGWFDTSGKLLYRDWQPLANTDLGRSQCWQLMMKYRLCVDVENENTMGPGWAGDCVSVHRPVTQRNLCQAAALSQLAKQKKLTKTCYQCDRQCSWLAPDSRCGDCTRFTREEIEGSVSESEEDL